MAFASATGWISLDTVVPHTSTPGRPGSFTATLYFDEGSATANRLFNPIDTYITWDSTNANRVNTTSEDFAMAWHIFNYNSSCWRAGVTAALDGNHNPMTGTWWGTNLPNMPLTVSVQS